MNLTRFGTHLPTLISDDRICNLIKYSKYCQPLGGYIAEFGVYAGGSLEILARHNADNDIIGIDSFQGLPKENKDIDFHKEGDFNEVNYYRIAGYFEMLYPRVRLFRGFSPDVFAAMDDNIRFSFVHVDVDLYDSVRHALDFFLPRLLTGGIMLLDDYKVKTTPGCEKAINEFFGPHNAHLVSHAEELKFWNSETARSHKQYLLVKS